MCLRGLAGQVARYAGTGYGGGMIEQPQNRAARIRSLLAALDPTMLDVVDDSAKHASHAGAKAGGQTNYNVTVISPRFEGLNRVARHRLVNQALEPEFGTGLHALSLVLRTPGEA